MKRNYTSSRDNPWYNSLLEPRRRCIDMRVHETKLMCSGCRKSATSTVVNSQDHPYWLSLSCNRVCCTKSDSGWNVCIHWNVKNARYKVMKRHFKTIAHPSIGTLYPPTAQEIYGSTNDTAFAVENGETSDAIPIYDVT
jgi:hypothetical protein